MQKAVIGGVGMTRFGKFMDSGLRPLSEEAVSVGRTALGAAHPHTQRFIENRDKIAAKLDEAD